MKEIVTQAIVLDKEDQGEQDAKVFLYSAEYGKLVGKVKSAKKITSKLNSHLEPFNLVSVRLIDKGPQIVDALLIARLTPSWPLLKFLNFIKEITLENQPDYHFWSLIRQSFTSGKINYRQLLAVQGFDPKFAVCQNCQERNPNYFFFRDFDFWCRNCLLLKGESTWSNGFIELSY